MSAQSRKTRAGGFTLLELLVVVLIIGLLAAIAVPQYFKVVEKGKAAEAFGIFDAIRSAQNRYLDQMGNYCTGAVATCTGFDLTLPTLKYFGAIPDFTAGAGSPSYKLLLTRNSAPAGYGAYVLTYDVEPAAPPAITCSVAACTADLLPE